VGQPEFQLSARTRLADEIAARIRDLILDGTLPPRQPLLQVELCSLLGVSRTPLREAFRILERDGFIRPANGNKTMEVVEVTLDEMFEMYVFREIIDGLAARLAAERGLSAGEIDMLRNLLETLRDRAHSPGGERATAHALFHASIAEMSGNRYVISQIPVIRLTAQVLSRPVRLHAMSAPARNAALIDEGDDDHNGVLDAIVDRDPDRAESIARRHIRKTIGSGLLDQPPTRSRATDGSSPSATGQDVLDSDS
jgi:GntR family transcriptional regulator of vanillate catabolism